ncbi:MAG: ABC transporter ATP-binding protein [Candidatus Dojkabacteria bacterium]|nr:ABC transporter ATP-binding protein [Candidatus Dojkabacteria bacterium]MDQ7021552.1 ABC transporter ATP-binding protein [Candidatus Dojkabacteria bacterium]
MEIIKVNALNKSYKQNLAVKNASFSVIKGEIFGILGPNGAGKTTMLEMIEGLRSIDSGGIIVNNVDVNDKDNRASLQEIIGVQLQSSAYFDKLKLVEILDLFGSMYKKKKDPIELLKMVGLYEKRNELVKNLSGGQAQRFSIIAALINDPDIVFLDEPTTGLDPNIRRELWELIKQINKEGKTIILTTHYMEEAEELCDRIAIMYEGSLIDLDTPQNLIIKQNLKFTIKFIPEEAFNDAILKKVSDMTEIVELWNEKEKIVLRIEDSKLINDILKDIEDIGIEFKNLEIIPPNLEDVFITLTGNSLRKGVNHGNSESLIK